MSSLRTLVAMVCVALLLPGKAAGQSYAIDQGSLLIGGQASVRSTETEVDEIANGRTVSVRTTYLSISPNILYFVAPGLAIGGELAISRSSSPELEDIATWVYGIGPAISYYFGGEPRAWYPYVGVGARVQGYLPEDQPAASLQAPHAYGLRADAGLLVMVAEEVGLNGELYFDAEHWESDWIERRSSEFGFALGVSAFVFR